MRHRRCTCDRFYTDCKSIHQEYEQSIATDPDKLGLSVKLPDRSGLSVKLPDRSGLSVKLPDRSGLSQLPNGSVELPESSVELPKVEPSKRSWETILEESLKDFTQPLIKLALG